MPVPTFVVAGAMKAGTTWIDEMLRTATNATLPRTTKELFYFDQFWERGTDWHSRQFDPTWTPDLGPIGEVASTYFASPQAAERLHATAPAASVIIVLRNPWERSWSHYRHLIRKGEVAPTTSFQLAIMDRPEIIAWSRYQELLEPWEQLFRDQLHILRYERLAEDAGGFARSIADAIGAELDSTALDPTRVNEAREPRSHAAAKAAGLLSHHLHRLGLHRVVELAKRVGVARVMERQQSEANPALRAEALDTARALLEREARELAARQDWPGWT